MFNVYGNIFKTKLTPQSLNIVLRLNLKQTAQAWDSALQSIISTWLRDHNPACHS